MSGELKDPRKSLVKGTFLAILITLLIYLALAVKFTPEIIEKSLSDWERSESKALARYLSPLCIGMPMQIMTANVYLTIPD